MLALKEPTKRRKEDKNKSFLKIKRNQQKEGQREIT